MEGDRRAGEVHQTERPQSNSERLARNGVNLSGVSNPLFKEQTGFIEPRHKEAVHNKTRAIGTHNDHFSKHLAILNHFVDGFLTGGFGGNDLDETVLGRVVEEVQTNKAVSTAGGLSQSVHGKG